MDVALTFLDLILSIIKGALRVVAFLTRRIFALISALLARRSASQQGFEGTGRAVDGDSINFGSMRVRIFGIDAPELGQDQGGAAHQALREFISGETLQVHPIERDQYGRIVARVHLEDGTDVGEAMVAGGFARAATAHSSLYAIDERKARHAGRGLWASGDIADPARWRRNNRR